MTTSLLRIPNVQECPVAKPASTTETSRQCTTSLHRFRSGKFIPFEDNIAIESDLLVHVDGYGDLRLCRTPGDDLNLITGHLFCKGLLRSTDGLRGITFHYDSQARAEVLLDKRRPSLTPFPRRNAVRLVPEKLFELKEAFEHRQRLFKYTGSTHAAALFSLQGQLLAYGEDVGRHNAFDKAIGRALQEGTLRRAAIAMLSSRMAVDLTAKAAKADIPILCGFSAATSSGIDFADRHDITLVGRLRKTSFDVYAHPFRLQGR